MVFACAESILGKRALFYEGIQNSEMFKTTLNLIKNVLIIIKNYYIVRKHTSK